MTQFDIDHFLAHRTFGFVFIFSRVAALLMLLPGIGEAYVSPRIRMMLALLLSLLLLTPLAAHIPPAPQDLPTLARLILYEIFVGIYLGTLLRILLDSLETVGAIIALQTGLSNATVLNPLLATQSPLPSAFLSIVGVTLMFVTDLDHVLLRGMVTSYESFPPGGTFVMDDFTQSVIRTMGTSFKIGVELASPFIIMGLLLFMALGMIQKLMPMVQLFLITLPIQIWGGLFLLSMTISGLTIVWLDYFQESVGHIFLP